jgi:hypothetical protein
VDSSPEDFAEFGTDSSIYGDLIAAGSPSNDNGGTNRGTVDTYEWGGTTWDFVQTLVGDNDDGDKFGGALDIYEDRLIVGASVATTGAFTSAGAAFIYNWNGTSWSLEQKIGSSTPVNTGKFGQNVSISKNRVAVSEIYASDPAIHVFDWDGGTWNHTQKITISGVTTNTVSLDQDRMVVGEFSGGDTVYVFEWNGATWSQTQAITSGDIVSSDNFGASISLQKNRLVVGARSQNSSQGAAYIFELVLNTWTFEQKLTNITTPAGLFGSSVSLDEDRIVVGASVSEKVLVFNFHQ